MATVIDALLVTLGLDPKPFQQGTADAKKELKGLGDEGRRQSIEETKRHKEREAQAKATVQGITKIKNEVIGMAAALVSASGIMAFVASITKSDAAVGRLSNNLGMNVKELTAWKGAAEKLGGTGADIEGAFRNINRIMQEHRLKGSSSAFAPLGAAHVDLAKFIDSATTIEQRALMVADAMKKMSPQDGQFRGGQAGFSEGSVNVLMNGSKAINEQVEAARKMAAMSDEDKAAAKARTDAWANLEQALTKTGRSITTWLTPAIEWVLELLADMPEAILAVGALSTVFATLTMLKFGGLIAGVGGIGTAVAALLPILKTVTLAFGALWGAYQITRLIGAVKDLWDVNNREGVTLTPEAQARIARGETQGVGAGAGTGSGSGGSLADSPFGKLIAKGEGDYNSVNRGRAGGYRSGTEDLGSMTVAEVMAAQKSHRFNAAGRYQVIGGTLSDAVKALGLNGSEKFNKATQDQIFESYLVNNKRKAIGDYLSGKSDNIGAALEAVSKEWASVASPATGRSAYAGMGNNASSITSGAMMAALQSSRAANMRRNGGGSSSTTDVKVGQVTIHTQATDAKGIAIDMGDAIQQHSFASSANVGIQ